MNYSTFAPCTSFAGFNSGPTTKWADDSTSLEESRLVQQYLKLMLGEQLPPPPATRVPSFTVHMASKYVVEPALLPLGQDAYLPPGYFAHLPTPPPPPTPAAEEPAEPAKPFGDWVTPSADRAQKQRDADQRRAFREREAKREQARLEAELALKRAETARRKREAQARKNGVSAAALAAQGRADARTKSGVA